MKLIAFLGLAFFVMACSDDDSPVTPQVVKVTGVTLNVKEVSLMVGAKETLKVVVAPENATNKRVSWSSNKTDVASVDGQGVVTAHKAGEALVTVKSEDGGKTATCKVTVKAEKVAVTGVKLDKTEHTLAVGGTVTLVATVTPEGATNKKVSWKSDKTDIATVDENGNYVSQPGNNWTIGAPINIYYDYKADGVYQYSDFDVYSDRGSLTYKLKNTVDTDGDGVADAPLSRNDNVEPGSVKLRDVNGDGKINEDDRVVYQKDPDATFSLSTNLRWKGFDFFMDWYAVAGGYILNPLMYDGEYGGDLRGRSNGMKVDYWTPYNPSNTAPRPKYGSEVPYMRTLAYQDASYLRLRTIQLGYTLPKKVTSKLKIQNLRFYMTATNLLTFTKVLSYSPEVTGNLYPETQQTVFGVNFSF